MKRLRSFFLLLAVCVFTAPSFGQMIQDPTDWKYEVKKKGANEYQLIFHLDLKAGWHIWSLTPGGDGYEIGTSFTFDQNNNVKLKGKYTEKGKKTTTTMAGIDGKITYLSGKIDYMQNITVTGPAKVTGKLNYQVCNDRMCLPPKDKDFVFDVKL